MLANIRQTSVQEEHCQNSDNECNRSQHDKPLVAHGKQVLPYGGQGTGRNVNAPCPMNPVFFCSTIQCFNFTKTKETSRYIAHQLAQLRERCGHATRGADRIARRTDQVCVAASRCAGTKYLGVSMWKWCERP